MKRHTVNLRAVEPEDVDFMFACESEEEAARWTDYRAPISRAQLADYALNYDADPFSSGQLRLIIETWDGPDGKDITPVGILDVYDISEKDGRAFLGITVNKKFRKQGYGASALNRFKTYNENKLGLRKVLAKISTQNIPALSLFAKENFRQIAFLPKWHRIGNTFHDMLLFEWEADV